MTNEEFIKRLVPSLNNIKDNDDYIRSRFTIYKNYMERAEVPVPYILDIVQNPIADKSVYKKDVVDFVEHIKEFMGYEFNCIFNYDKYYQTDQLAAYIIQRYISDYLAGNDPIRNIIYIDAVTYTRSLKKLIGKDSSDMVGSSVYSQETMTDGLENADFVIWDKITYLQTNYERSELYNILSIRHKKGLGNLFFTIKGKQHISDTLGDAICSFLSGCSLVQVK